MIIFGSLQYFVDVAEANSWLSDRKPPLLSRDQGRDESSTAALLQRHQWLEKELGSFGAEIRRLWEQARSAAQLTALMVSVGAQEAHCLHFLLEVPKVCTAPPGSQTLRFSKGSLKVLSEEDRRTICFFPLEAEPQHIDMIQYSDSSGEEDGPTVMMSSQLHPKSGRGFERALPLETKANVRFRYSRGTELRFSDILKHAIRLCDQKGH